MQSFVEQHIGPGRNCFPGRELTRSDAKVCVGRRFLVVMKIKPALAGARLAIGTKQVFQFLEQIGFRTEMAETAAAFLFRFSRLLFHFRAVVTMETVTFDNGRHNPLTPEHVGERFLDSRRTGS
ncbi:MAG: hypothetical protein FD153_1132 [Rhodospirillaceae bacterium]|nr:MAG: hypothetical protein FD153_1132 [Rhodospirillaceae bacterium]